MMLLTLLLAWQSARMAAIEGVVRNRVAVAPGVSTAAAGKVVDEDGDPISRCTVSAARSEFEWHPARRLTAVGQASTNDLGEYRIFGLLAGNYVLTAQCGHNQFDSSDAEEPEVWRMFSPEYAARVRLEPGVERSGVDLRMRRVVPVPVQGKVSGVSKERLKDLSVALHRHGDHGDAVAREAVRDDATFRFPDVAPGTYRVLVLSSSFDVELGKPWPLAGMSEVVVGSVPPKPVEVAVEPQPPLEGRIEYESEVDWREEPRIHIYPNGPSGCAAGGYRPFIPSAVFSSRETFQLPSVTPGECFVDIEPGRGYVKSVSLAGEPIIGRRMRIRPGMTGPLRIVIGIRPASIEGLIKGGARKGFVVLAPTDGSAPPHVAWADVSEGARGSVEVEMIAGKDAVDALVREE